MRQFERPRRRWEDNIKINLKGIGYKDLDWVSLTWNREKWKAVENAFMNLRFP